MVGDGQGRYYPSRLILLLASRSHFVYYHIPTIINVLHITTSITDLMSGSSKSSLVLLVSVISSVCIPFIVCKINLFIYNRCNNKQTEVELQKFLKKKIYSLPQNGCYKECIYSRVSQTYYRLSGGVPYFPFSCLVYCCSDLLYISRRKSLLE